MLRRLLAAAPLLPLAAACSTAVAQTPPPAATPAAPPQPVARAQLKNAEGGDAGLVTAFHGPAGVLFRVEGRGWPGGWHGVHLHAVGTCEGPAFTSAGAHVNHAESPRPHGLLNAAGPDLGDLQNVWAGADGAANAEVYLSTHGLDPRSFLDADGVSFLVHANPDDHVSQPIGGAGPRIACGVFERME